jgi:Xaa-Pro aminopeptidase
LGARRAGFEDETVTVGRRHALGRAAEAVEWVGVGEALNLLRVRKSPEEIATLKRAAAVAERAWERVRGRLVPGVSERDMAIELEYAMRQEGATGPSFETIVASGPRGALPHGVASDRRIAEGDVVVVDWGCVFEGYCSDQTISVMVGDVGDEARRVYDVVFAAQSAALARLAPGAALREVDAAARDLIAAAGYGDYFGHGLGHGVGLEVHEAPRVAATSEAVAEAGMVVTIEPGVYLPGRFGVRLEDTVAVTADGYERITTLDKAPPSAA